MTLFCSFPGMTAAIALGVVALVQAADPEIKGKSEAAKEKGKSADTSKKSDGKSETSKEQEKTAQGLGSFGKMLPLGQKNLDVKIPSFKDGKPDSFVRAGSMTRQDDTHMDMENTDILIYGATLEADMRVQLPAAIYDMSTQVMTSDTRSRISRADFQLEGDTLVFDTRSQQGKMTGHIHMIIYDANMLSKKPEAADEPAAGKQPGVIQDKEKK